MTRQMAKELLLLGKKVTHNVLTTQYLEYNDGIRTEEGQIFSCEFYNNESFKIGWIEYHG